jgi:hypothetical protein
MTSEKLIGARRTITKINNEWIFTSKIKYCREAKE